MDVAVGDDTLAVDEHGEEDDGDTTPGELAGLVVGEIDLAKRNAEALEQGAGSVAETAVGADDEDERAHVGKIGDRFEGRVKIRPRARRIREGFSGFYGDRRAWSPDARTSWRLHTPKRECLR